MNAKEKVEIVFKVIVENQPQKDVAKAHRVGQATVCQLVKRAKTNKKFLAELLNHKNSQDDK